ncbi:MAG: glycosyltransferase family 2 protein, partial [Pseudomonadota bacterium]
MTVAIVMGTYNGAKYLDAQLQSIADQTWADWTLVASDDGSTDSTARILRAFKDRYPSQVTLCPGPRKGLAANFLAALRHIPRDITAVAFCDQDDVWAPAKLKRAIHRLGHTTTPTLYCSRRTICDQFLTPIGVTPRPIRRPCFANAMIENIASGNVTVLNPTAAKLMLAAQPGRVAYHDWWAYQLVTGAGGRIVFDNAAPILYRQHGQNHVGAAKGAAAWTSRIRRVAQGQFCADLDLHDAALRKNRHLLTPENQALLDRWSNMRHQCRAAVRPLPAHR